MGYRTPQIFNVGRSHFIRIGKSLDFSPFINYVQMYDLYWVVVSSNTVTNTILKMQWILSLARLFPKRTETSLANDI